MNYLAPLDEKETVQSPLYSTVLLQAGPIKTHHTWSRMHIIKREDKTFWPGISCLQSIASCLAVLLPLPSPTCTVHSTKPSSESWQFPSPHGQVGTFIFPQVQPFSCHLCSLHSHGGPYAAAAAKPLQSCPTLCDPIGDSPPGSPVPGILQARTLEWVAISFSNAGKWKVRVKSLSRVRLLEAPWTVAYQAPPSTGLSRQEHWSGVPLPSLCLVRFK